MTSPSYRLQIRIALDKTAARIPDRIVDRRSSGLSAFRDNAVRLLLHLRFVLLGWGSVVDAVALLIGPLLLNSQRCLAVGFGGLKRCGGVGRGGGLRGCEG